VPLAKNPKVGEPPFIHEDATFVENPSPNSLSKNAQRKMNPISIRKKENILVVIN